MTRITKRRQRPRSALSVALLTLSSCAATESPYPWGIITCRGGNQQQPLRQQQQQGSPPRPPSVRTQKPPQPDEANHQRSKQTRRPPAPPPGTEIGHSAALSFAQKAAALLGHSIPPPPPGILPRRTRIETLVFPKRKAHQHHGHALVDLILREESRVDRFLFHAIDNALLNYFDPIEVYAQAVSEYFEPSEGDGEVVDEIDVYRRFGGTDEFSDSEDDDLEHVYDVDFKDLSLLDAEQFYESDDDDEVVVGPFDDPSCGDKFSIINPSISSPDAENSDDYFEDEWGLEFVARPLQPIIAVVRPKEKQIVRRTVTRTRQIPQQTMLSSLEAFDQDLDDDEFDLLLQDMAAPVLVEQEYSTYEYDELDPFAVEQETTILLPFAGNSVHYDNESVVVIPLTGSDLQEDTGAEDSDEDENDDEIIHSASIPETWQCPDYDRFGEEEDEELQKESAKKQISDVVPSFDLKFKVILPPSYDPEYKSEDHMGDKDWDILNAADLLQHDSDFVDELDDSEEDLAEPSQDVEDGGPPEAAENDIKLLGESALKIVLPPRPPPPDHRSQVPPPPREQQKQVDWNGMPLPREYQRREWNDRPPPPPQGNR